MRQSSSNNHDRGGGDKPGRGGASPPPKGPGKAGEGPARPHCDRTPDRSNHQDRQRTPSTAKGGGAVRGGETPDSVTGGRDSAPAGAQLQPRATQAQHSLPAMNPMQPYAAAGAMKPLAEAHLAVRHSHFSLVAVALLKR